MVLDPTRTAMLRLQYARQLRSLVKRFRKNVRPLLLDELSVEVVDVDRVEQVISNRIRVDITTPSENVIGVNIKLAYKRGVAMAEASYRKAVKAAAEYVDPAYYAVDSEEMLLLQQQNLALVTNASVAMKAGMMQALTNGMVQGYGINKIASMMVKETGIGLRRATVIARTEIIRACNHAAKVRYQAWGVGRFEWIASDDERSCDVCPTLNGQIFTWAEMEPPPLHPQCRCSIAAVVEK